MAFDQELLKGTTSYLVEVMVRDSATGQGKTSLAAASVTCTFWREGAATGTAVTLDGTMSLGTWKTGGWVEVDSTNRHGLYQFGIPNAAIATGANAVTITFQATGMIDKAVRVVLVDVNTRDAVRGGMTALPSSGTLAVNPTLNATQAYNNTGQTTKLAATLASTDVTGNVAADVQTIKTQTVTCAAGVTVLASVGTATVSTAQTGDNFARIGVAGAGLTAIGDARLANLDAAISTRSTYAGADTAGTTTLLTRIPGTVQPQTGDAYARLGVAGAGLTALGDTRMANLDAAVSTRSTYAGADTSGTTTLLARLTGIRAGLLDNLDAAVSTRLAATSYTAPDNATIGTTGTAAAAIKAKTDQLTFTVTGHVDATATIGGNVTVGGYAAGQDPATLLAAWTVVNTTTFQTIVRDVAAIFLGTQADNADHTTSSFSDVNDPSTTRVTSVNTPTSRTPTLN